MGPSLERRSSAAKDHGVSNLATLAADADEIQITLARRAEFPGGVASLVLAPIGLPMRKNIVGVRPSGRVMTTAA